MQYTENSLGVCLPTICPCGCTCAVVLCLVYVAHLHTHAQVIIAGRASHPATEALLNAAHAAWAPDKAVILIDPTSPDSAAFWRTHNPDALKMVESHYSRHQGGSGAASTAAAAAPAGVSDAAAAGDGDGDPGGDSSDGGFTPTAFVCQNFTCQAPTTEAAKVYELLSRQGSPPGVKLQPVKL